MQTPAYRLLRSLVAVALGVVLLAFSAEITVPMVPVRTSMLTFAMVLVALLGGGRIGIATTTVYVALVLFGPLSIGAQELVGAPLPEAAVLGYLVGLVPAAAVAGFMAHRDGFGQLWAAALVGHAVMLGVGVSVLATSIGVPAALTIGLAAHVAAAVLKSALAAAIVAVVRPPRDEVR